MLRSLSCDHVLIFFISFIMCSRGGAGEVISHLILFFYKRRDTDIPTVRQSDLVSAVPLIPLKYHVKSL